MTGTLMRRSAAALVPLALLAAAAACGGSAPEELTFDLDISDRVLEPDVVRVKQEDTVTLNFRSDEPGSVHVHGYDVETDTEAGQTAAVSFAADATGSFRITFHPRAASHSEEGSGMSHEPIEAEAPVSVDLTAEAEQGGGVNLRIVTEGWRFAPWNVDKAHTAGEGHAHVYVDGEKVGRVYGSNHYLKDLEPGERSIRVTLNANSHNALLVNGRPAEAMTTVTVTDRGPMTGPEPDPVEAQSQMSASVAAHTDAAGGHIIQVTAAGFTFSPENVGRPHAAGQGYGSVSIDGEAHTRLYEPWLQLPALEPGMHTITVALLTNDHRPYSWSGEPVEAVVTVHSGDQEGDGEGGSDTGGEHEHETAAAEPEEIPLGSLEVHPR